MRNVRCPVLNKYVSEELEIPMNLEITMYGMKKINEPEPERTGPIGIYHMSKYTTCPQYGENKLLLTGIKKDDIKPKECSILGEKCIYSKFKIL